MVVESTLKRFKVVMLRGSRRSLVFNGAKRLISTWKEQKNCRTLKRFTKIDKNKRRIKNEEGREEKKSNLRNRKRSRLLI